MTLRIDHTMKRFIFILLFSFSCIGLVSCGGGTTTDPDDEASDGDSGGDTPDDESPSIDEDGSSNSDTDTDTDIDDGMTDTDEDIDVETPDIDEGGEEEGEDDEGEEIASPKILSFSAGEQCIRPGSKVTLTWETGHAAEVYLGSTLVAASGSKKVRPFFETTYTLTAVNGDETESKNVSIYFKEASIAYETSEYPFGGGEIDALSSSDDGTLLILSEGKVYQGRFGDDFSKLTPNSSVSEWNVVEIDPADSGILYAGTTGRVYRSTNGGDSWPDVIPIRRNNVDLDLNVVYASPADPDLVYIGFEGGGFVLDTDRNTLELKSDLNTESVRHFAADSDCVIAATKSGIFASFNEGDSWREKDAAGWGEIHSLDIFNGTLYVSAEKGLYSAPTDSLSDPSWEKMEGLNGPVYQALVRGESFSFASGRGFAGLRLTTPFPRPVLYAAAETGLYRQSGDVWEKVADGEAYWILDDDEPIAVSEESMSRVERAVVYSEDCPNQPRTHTISSDFITPPFPLLN